MNEKDPNGIPAGSPGSKLDAGKNRLGLVLGSFGNALWAVGEVGTYGATKYCDHGWEQVPDGVERYTDAMLRHYFKEATGEQSDPDTNLLHAAHTAWNALARLELMIRDRKKDFEFPDIVASIRERGPIGLPIDIPKFTPEVVSKIELPARQPLQIPLQIPAHIPVEIPERFR